MTERLFRRVSFIILNRRRALVIVGLLAIAVSVFGATRMELAAGYDTWLSTDSDTYQGYERFNRHFGSDTIIVMVSGDGLDQLLSNSNLRAMEKVELRLGNNPGVISAVSPAFLLRMLIAEETGSLALPTDGLELGAMATDSSGRTRAELQEVLPDQNHALVPIVLRGGMDRADQKDVVAETRAAVSEAGFVDVEAIVTGSPAFTSELEDLISDSMRSMFIMAIVLMFVILALIFSVRGVFAWRWLPLGAVGIGIMYTFGAAGLLNIPITMVSMSVFPILIGLGVDYSIQLHNRYDEEVRKGSESGQAVRTAVRQVGPAIGIALVAVCLGFAAMLFSPVPMIQDFGIMLIVGVVASYAVALFFPLLVLHWRATRPQPARSGKPDHHIAVDDDAGWVERMLRRIAPWVIRNPATIIPLALILTAAGLVADFNVKTETDMANIISTDVPVMRDYKTLEEVAGGVTTVSVLVEADDVTDPRILSWLLAAGERIGTELVENVRSTKSVASVIQRANGGEIPDNPERIRGTLSKLPQNIKRNLISDDHRAANLVVGMREFDIDRMEKLRQELSESVSDTPDGVICTVTGTTVIESELLRGMGGGRLTITLIGVGFVFLGLLLLFRFSIVKAGLAILPIALIIGWSGGLIYSSGLKYSPLTATLGALILGIGVEYTILLMMRYYEERDAGLPPAAAMTMSLTKTGRAVTASGLTTAGGFAALLAAGGFLIVRDFGIMTLMNVFLALASTLIVLPPLIVLVDSWREKRRLTASVDTSEGSAP